MKRESFLGAHVTFEAIKPTVKWTAV